jgi:hypothetical protein
MKSWLQSLGFQMRLVPLRRGGVLPPGSRQRRARQHGEHSQRRVVQGLHHVHAELVVSGHGDTGAKKSVALNFEVCSSYQVMEIPAPRKA